jgi:hypothetical protein
MTTLAGLAGAPPMIKVTIGKPTILGSSDRWLIRRAAKPLLRQLRGCYRQQLGRRPKLAGAMLVQFCSVRTNRVTDVKVLRTTVNDRPLRRCVARAFMIWRLPSNCKGGVSRIVLPVVFRRVKAASP